MVKPNEHFFLEMNLTDEQIATIIRGIVQGVEYYCLSNGIKDHIEPLKNTIKSDSEAFMRKINLSSNIY